METPHFQAAVTVITSALGDRLAPGITSFPELFGVDAIIDVPFDNEGSAAPISGRAAIEDMAQGLQGILHFEEVTIDHVHQTAEAAIIVLEYRAVLTRSDLGQTFIRRYISVIELRDRRIHSMREYGGPFMPWSSASTISDDELSS